MLKFKNLVISIMNAQKWKYEQKVASISALFSFLPMHILLFYMPVFLLYQCWTIVISCSIASLIIWLLCVSTSTRSHEGRIGGVQYMCYLDLIGNKIWNTIRVCETGRGEGTDAADSLSTTPERLPGCHVRQGNRPTPLLSICCLQVPGGWFTFLKGNFF